MKINNLGASDIKVSELCLGTMTWGKQNNQQEADSQIEAALAAGINFMDTAEMYAVPPSPDTYGKTEDIIGNWLQRNSHKRQQIILASKISGPGLPWVRGGSEITAESMDIAINDSLARLKTDYIDLYQIHWPHYNNFHWGKQWPFAIEHTETAEQTTAKLSKIQTKLAELITAGKIRSYGLSNESPWGLHTYLNLAAANNLPKPVSVQNEFNLLMSKDSHYMLESCIKENIAYLPWSPIAGGALTGKYLDGKVPAGSRWSLDTRENFRNTKQTAAAVKKYVALAQAHNISPAQLSLAFCLKTPGITATIFGATTMQQLRDNLTSINVNWTQSLQEETIAILKQYPQCF